MKKRLLMLALTAAVSFGVMACGSAEQAADGGSGNDKAGTEEVSKDAIRVVNGKIEIDSVLKDVAKKYEKETGQKVAIESLGGGVDISGQIKSYLAADNMPDIFVIGGEGDYTKNWKGLCEDLSDCKFAKDTDFQFKDEEGKLIGFPYAIEGYGITYNKDILEKAGVDPKSLVNYEAFKEAFEKIDAKKKELGLTAVCSVAAESGQMYWSTGNHMFGYYLSGGVKRDDKTYIDELLKGKLDEPRMDQFAKFTKLLFDYSDEQTLISGTYDDQLALWANGKAAFITEGNWIDPSLPDYNVEFDCGIAPLAFTKEDMPGILADCPSWWCVYNKGKHIDECKKFLDYLAESEEGQKALVIDGGMVSPYKSSKIEPTTPLAVSLKSYVDSDNTYAWDWTKMPEGIAPNSLGLVFESYAKGDLNEKQFVKMMGTQVEDYISKTKEAE